ncbi:MAG: hypothetical protein J6U21_14075, partial [Bacteroidales bacterium]|nr:hypothetical protein [Bacteroidales bacterium]
KPHVFLNEAKLSALATAIKLSILDYRISSAAAPDCLKILVLDDIMISMDMSNRDVVLDIILEKANDYQIILMTHDRAFYNLIKSRLINRKINNSWVYREMYQFNNQNILKPIIINPKSYLDVAYKYMMDCDYPASANYMRKECERILGEILPKDKVFIFPDIPDLKGQIETVDAGGEKVYQLQNLIANFVSFCLETGINVSEYQKILEFKDMLLNPLSHNNFNTPIYRRELVECYNILLKLNELNAKIEKTTIGDNGDKFNLRFSDGTKNYVYTFHLKNEFYKYKLNGQNIWRNEPYGSMSWEEDNKVQYIGENLADPANPVIPCYDLKDFINFLMKTHFPKHKHISITNMSNGWTNIWDVAYIINDDGSETLLKDL